MKTNYISIIFFSLFLSKSILADNPNKIYGYMHPLKSEMLKTPITLSHCKNVQIIEWEKTFDIKYVDIIDNTCKLVIDNFDIFIKTENIKYYSIPKFSWNICLLPIDDQYRNMNDIFFRFKDRDKRILSDGSVVQIPGYTAHQLHDIFIYNQINDKKFVIVLAHELFHALSWHNGIYKSHNGNKNKADEILAIRFTKYLGL